MDDTTTIEIASQLYNAATALLNLFDSKTVSSDDIHSIFSGPTGRLSISSVAVAGENRATRFAKDLLEQLFPPLPAPARISGVIFSIYSAGTMTTEEYAAINRSLLENIPDEIPVVVNLSQQGEYDECFKGSLIISWEMRETHDL